MTDLICRAIFWVFIWQTVSWTGRKPTRWPLISQNHFLMVLHCGCAGFTICEIEMSRCLHSLRASNVFLEASQSDCRGVARKYWAFCRKTILIETMNLTTTEKKLLEQLRRQETWMFRSRYWFVAGGIFCYAAAAYFASLMQHLTQTIGDNPAMGAFLFSFVFPCFIVIFHFA